MERREDRRGENKRREKRGRDRGRLTNIPKGEEEGEQSNWDIENGEKDVEEKTFNTCFTKNLSPDNKQTNF